MARTWELLDGGFCGAGGLLGGRLRRRRWLWLRRHRGRMRYGELLPQVCVGRARLCRVQSCPADAPRYNGLPGDEGADN